jgi:peroxiredoxin
LELFTSRTQMKSLRGIFLIFSLSLMSFMIKASDSITVYVFLLESCQICQNQTAELNNIHQKYTESGIKFIGIFPNNEFSTQEGIDSFQTKYQLKFPLKFDPYQVIAMQYQATITPEVVVIRDADQKILYRGKIDNSYERVGIRRSVITEFYLKDALNQILDNKEIIIPQTTAVGCFIMKKTSLK